MARIQEFSDNFNRADGDVGANWNDFAGTTVIAGNRMKVESSNECAVVQAMTDTDQYIEATLQTIGDSGCRPGLILRASANNNNDNHYQAQFRTSTNDILIYRRISDSSTAIFTSSTISSSPYANGDVLAFECETNGSGNVELRVYVNDVLEASYTDSDGSKLTTGSYVGIRDSVANTYFDDFSAGTLGEAAAATVLRVNIGQTGTGVRII